MSAFSGRTVVVTRAADDAAVWADLLAQRGARPVILPCIVTEPICDETTVTRLRVACADAQWLVLTSRRGVELLANMLGSRPAGLRVAVIGEVTARAAREVLGRADLVASVSTSRGLGETLLARVRCTDRVVVAGTAAGSGDAEAALRGAGISTERVDLYRTIPAPETDDKQDLAALGVDDILLASPSAVTGLLHRAVPPRAARIITIGPTTSAAVRAAGLAVAAEARRPNFEGMEAVA